MLNKKSKKEAKSLTVQFKEFNVSLISQKSDPSIKECSEDYPFDRLKIGTLKLKDLTKIEDKIISIFGSKDRLPRLKIKTHSNLLKKDILERLIDLNFDKTGYMSDTYKLYLINERDSNLKLDITRINKGAVGVLETDMKYYENDELHRQVIIIEDLSLFSKKEKDRIVKFAENNKKLIIIDVSGTDFFEDTFFDAIIEIKEATYDTVKLSVKAGYLLEPTEDLAQKREVDRFTIKKAIDKFKSNIEDVLYSFVDSVFGFFEWIVSILYYPFILVSFISIAILGSMILSSQTNTMHYEWKDYNKGSISFRCNINKNSSYLDLFSNNKNEDVGFVSTRDVNKISKEEAFEKIKNLQDICKDKMKI